MLGVGQDKGPIGKKSSAEIKNFEKVSSGRILSLLVQVDALNNF
jgi:hypothetical protein